MKQYSIRLEEDFKQMIDEKCFEERVTFSYVSRFLLEKWLEGKIIITQPELRRGQ